jgi:hypothetical protein
VRIAIIGAGNVGRALGSAWSKRQFAVTYGVKDPDAARYADLRAAGAAFASPRDAAQSADAVVLATPWEASLEAVRSLGDLTGKLLIDCTNPVAFGAGGVRLVAVEGPSAAALIAAAAPGAAVFKTLNQAGADVLGAAERLTPRGVMFVAGDDAARKAEAMALVSALGFEARDAGPLRNAAALEGLALLWIDQAMRGPMGRGFAFALASWAAR